MPALWWRWRIFKLSTLWGEGFRRSNHSAKTGLMAFICLIFSHISHRIRSEFSFFCKKSQKSLTLNYFRWHHYDANDVIKNTCVKAFLTKTGLKAYMTLLTGEPIKLHLRLSCLEIFNSSLNFLKCAPDKSLFKFTRNARMSRPVLLKGSSDCANNVKPNSKHFSRLKKLKRM